MNQITKSDIQQNLSYMLVQMDSKPFSITFSFFYLSPPLLSSPYHFPFFHLLLVFFYFLN